MSSTSHARAERAALCDLLAELGPDAPTLCGGWTTRDLAAHLVVREYRPDASVGIVVKQAAGWTDRVQSGAAEQPFEELIDQIRSGPPVYNPMSLPMVDGLVNLQEYFVHLEDIRRAQPGWQPRDISDELSDAVWSRLSKAAKGLFRKSRVGVVLERTDGAGGRVVARDGEPSVTLIGPASELIMIAFGRKEHRAEVKGTDEAVANFLGTPLGI